MPISLFGWLDNIPWWKNLSYPVKSALLRAMKAALSTLVAILLTAATQGVLFPTTFSPVVGIAIVAILQAVDKFLRETEDAQEVDLGLNDPNNVFDSPPDEETLPSDEIPTADLDKSPPSND